MARKRDTLDLPRIDAIVLPELTDGDALDLRAGARLDSLRLTGLNAAGAELGELTLDGCELSELVFDDANLRGVRVLESVATHISATTLRAANATWRDVRVADSRFGAAELYDAEWTSVEVVNSKIGYLNLRGARLRDVRITDCVIEELDLREASCLRVSLERCRVGSLECANATLEHVDLRGTDVAAVDTAGSLRGATIDETQLLLLAPLMARALGISVR